MKIIFKPFPSYDVINLKLGQKGPEFVHYLPTVIERLKSIITQYLRSAIHFSGQFSFIFQNPDASPIPYVLVVKSLTPNLIRKGPNSYITCKW